jgi:hypothetical protein
MPPLRRLILRYRHLAALILVAALLVRLAVPAGYMVERQDGVVTIGVCTATGGQTMTIEIPGLAKPAPAEPPHQPDAAPCAFAALSAPFLGAVDPWLLASALAIVAMLALAAATPPPSLSSPRLRPPLRAPPAHP